MLAAAVGGRAARAPRPWLAWSAAVALGAAGLLGYLETLRRYAVGVHGPLDFVGGPWHPVEGWPVALVWSVVAYALLVATLMRVPGRWVEPAPGGREGAGADGGHRVGAEGFEPSLGAV